MKRKNILILSSALLALTFLSLPVSVIVTTFATPSQYGETFLGELHEKVDRLKKTDGKRIVLIGGSAIPFGIRSAYIKEHLPDYEVVDFGMYASLGTSVMMDLAKARINEGDIVLLMPEQSEQTLSLYHNGQSLWQALDSDFSLFSYLSDDDRKALLANMYSFSQDKLFYAMNGKPVLSGVYQKSSFDSYGDIKEGLCLYNTMVNGYDSTSPIDFSTSLIQDDFIDYMNDFYQFILDKKASLYYHFSPMNLSALKTAEDDIDTFASYLNSKISFPILGNPHKAIMDSGWFYDTNYHLNDSGAICFTKELIKDLKAVLQDSSKTDIVLPSKPVVPDDILKEGNNDDLNCFTYSFQDKNVNIDSYISEKKEVIIPYSKENKKIVSFRENTFANNKTIEQITLQDNISMIYDGSFKNCSSLKKIILLNPTPSQIKIGADLLSGCNADLYVQPSALSTYKVDYTFSQYASRIHSLSEVES